MNLPVYLIGYMGAGKTTVGHLLADKLGWYFVDLDEAFAELNAMSTGEYIRTYGVENFRVREKDCVEKLAELPIQHVIYATGGGYPCWEDNMECLKELGTSVYLRWSNELLAYRIELSGIEQRPILGNRTGKELLDFVAWQMSGREQYYAQADLIVDAPFHEYSEAADEEIAEYLCNWIKENL